MRNLLPAWGFDILTSLGAFQTQSKVSAVFKLAPEGAKQSSIFHSRGPSLCICVRLVHPSVPKYVLLTNSPKAPPRRLPPHHPAPCLWSGSCFFPIAAHHYPARMTCCTPRPSALLHTSPFRKKRHDHPVFSVLSSARSSKLPMLLVVLICYASTTHLDVCRVGRLELHSRLRVLIEIPPSLLRRTRGSVGRSCLLQLSRLSITCPSLTRRVWLRPLNLQQSSLSLTNEAAFFGLRYREIGTVCTSFRLTKAC